MTEGIAHVVAGPARDVTYRPCRGRADYPAFAELATLAGVEEFSLVYTPDVFTRMFEEEIADFDAGSAMVAEAGGDVVGYGYGHWDGDRDDIGRVLWTTCRVHPGWRGGEVERVLLKAGQAGALRHAALQPQTALASVFRTLAAETSTAMLAVLAADGYRPIEWMHLMIRPNLDDPPADTLPPGIEVRPVRPENGLIVLRAMNEAMRDERSWIPQSEAAMATALTDPVWGQIDVWQVAWEGDEVVGGVLGWIDPAENERYGRLRGTTERIFTRRPWRGRGIAKALIGRNLRELARRGMTESALAVDSANPSGALGLYEGVGFRPDHTILWLERPVG